MFQPFFYQPFFYLALTSYTSRYHLTDCGGLDSPLKLIYSPFFTMVTYLTKRVLSNAPNR